MTIPAPTPYYDFKSKEEKKQVVAEDKEGDIDTSGEAESGAGQSNLNARYEEREQVCIQRAKNQAATCFDKGQFILPMCITNGKRVFSDRGSFGAVLQPLYVALF